MIGGVSGDMLLGALLDAGLSLDDLRQELGKLNSGGFEITSTPVKRGGIQATLAGVGLNDSGNRTRDWAEFERTIAESSMSPTIKETSQKVFDLLAKAESAAHGVSKEETHLHELGTVDTLVDIVGVIAGFELLGIKKISASPFPLSSGTSKSSHGVMAATAAATAEIYRITRAPVRAGGIYGPVGEAVTPTGAAIVATIASFEPTSFVAKTAGYGAGNRDPEQHPNVVGIWIGESPEPLSESGSSPASKYGDLTLDTNLMVLETNIDDMTGEALGYLQERLMESGALDAWLTQIQMKKGRPASLLSVLCRPDQENSLARLILRESTTLGVRRRAVERYVADREIISVLLKGTEDGVSIPVKIKRLDGEVIGIHPEYEDCRELAMHTGRALRDIVDEATAAARQSLDR